MSQNNLATTISIIAIHYSTNEILRQFIKNNSFANEVLILDLTKEETVVDENATIKKVTAHSFEQCYRESIATLRNDWFLFLYTTYSITPHLQAEVLNSILDNKNNGYRIKKEFTFLNKNLRFGTLERDATSCLLNKNDQLNNFKNENSNSFPVLKNKIINNSYHSFDSYNCSLTLLNTIEVEQLFLKNIKPNYSDFLLKPFWFFIKNYFIKGEILYGKEGYILTYIHSFAILKKELLLWLQYKNLE